jgi:hypothetical protein
MHKILGSISSTLKKRRKGRTYWLLSLDTENEDKDESFPGHGLQNNSAELCRICKVLMLHL